VDVVLGSASEGQRGLVRRINRARSDPPSDPARARKPPAWFSEAAADAERQILAAHREPPPEGERESASEADAVD
jgi:hypothetical protein